MIPHVPLGIRSNKLTLTSYFPEITFKHPTFTVSTVLGCLRGGHSILAALRRQALEDESYES